MLRRVSSSSSLFTVVAFGLLVLSFDTGQSAETRRQILAFYYGWWGNPQVSREWRHWQDVDPEKHRIGNSTDFPAFGAYDSHDPAIVDREVATARAAGITGFIASWWGQDSFEDRGVPLLLDAAAKHGLAVSAYYEKIGGEDAASRKAAAIADLTYLLARYTQHKAWLRADGKPVVFVYGRALHQLSPAEWQEVIAQVRRDNPGGVALVADALDPKYVGVFDGASTYNITGQTQHKTPPQIRDWAGACRLSEDPVTDRWGGETYRVLWQEAVAAAPDYVLITSWNEWHEGSEIEPSVEYGSVMLNDTAAFAHQFLAGRK